MVMVEEEDEEPGIFSLTQSCVFMSEETRHLLWPIHVTYRTSSGQTGSFVFAERSFELVIPLAENEAVWFNADMLGFYLPIPSAPYFIEKLMPVLHSFSEADRFGILYVMTKMFNPELLLAFLPEFNSGNSLAIKYLVDEIANGMQLEGSDLKIPPVNEALLIDLHKEAFLRHLSYFLDLCRSQESTACIDTQAIAIHAKHMCVTLTECQDQVLELAETMALGAIPIDLRLIVIQAMCQPAVTAQRPHLLDKVEQYFVDHLQTQPPSELKMCVLYGLLQSGKVETVLRVVPYCSSIMSRYPAYSEVARGLQVIHVVVRDRLIESLALVIS